VTVALLVLEGVGQRDESSGCDSSHADVCSCKGLTEGTALVEPSRVDVRAAGLGGAGVSLVMEVLVGCVVGLKHVDTV